MEVPRFWTWAVALVVTMAAALAYAWQSFAITIGMALILVAIFGALILRHSDHETLEAPAPEAPPEPATPAAAPAIVIYRSIPHDVLPR